MEHFQRMQQKHYKKNKNKNQLKTFQNKTNKALNMVLYKIR